MKFKINDQVIVTSGKDKGKKSKITAVWPKLNRVTVAGANVYTRHRRKMTGRVGEIIRLERPLPTANVAIVNEQGKPDRIGYLKKEDGTKVRIYKKTKTEITESKA
jgi:large subunit ribosomal protein L24